MSDLNYLNDDEDVLETFDTPFFNDMVRDHDDIMSIHEEEQWKQVVLQLGINLSDLSYIPPRTRELEEKAYELIDKINEVYSEWRELVEPIYEKEIQRREAERLKANGGDPENSNYDDIPF